MKVFHIFFLLVDVRIREAQKLTGPKDNTTGIERLIWRGKGSLVNT